MKRKSMLLLLVISLILTTAVPAFALNGGMTIQSNRFTYSYEKSNTSTKSVLVTEEDVADADEVKYICAGAFAISGGWATSMGILVGDYMYDRNIAGTVKRSSYTITKYKTNLATGKKSVEYEKLYVKGKIYKDGNLVKTFSDTFTIR